MNTTINVTMFKDKNTGLLMFIPIYQTIQKQAQILFHDLC